MVELPTLRRKILRAFSVLVALYAALGLMLVVGVNVASKTTPKLLHVNYDSIAAARRMDEAWSALRDPSFAAGQTAAHWKDQFENALKFEESNVTEPGEAAIARAIREDWVAATSGEKGLGQARFEAMRKHLADLLEVNERGMFGLAQANVKLSREVMGAALLYFLLSLLVSVLYADRIAERLSQPLKSIAEALHGRPSYDRRLKLPEPTSLELLILTTELSKLWKRLSESEKVNVAELLNEKYKLETLLESVDDGLLVLGPDGRVLHSNARVGRLVGLPREQLERALWRDLPTMSGNYIKLRDTLREGMPESQQLELLDEPATSSGAETRFFSARSRKIGGTDEHAYGVLYLLHDITEKKQREKFRAEFIDLLSHELKTPLQSLGTASELLCAQKGALPQDARPLVETVAEDVERIRAVAQEFVQVTQSQSRILKLKLEQVALNELLPEWLRPFHVVAKDRGVRIEFAREGSDVIWARLDLVKFPWVISNLLSNAVRFSPENGVVTVRLTDRNGAVEVQVRDEGPGVPITEEGRIFEPFYQSPMVTASGARGLFGIGLTIAKEVVEAHEGRIEYHRLQPRGSEFRILLPFPPLARGADQSAETKSWTH